MDICIWTEFVQVMDKSVQCCHLCVRGLCGYSDSAATYVSMVYVASLCPWFMWLAYVSMAYGATLCVHGLCGYCMRSWCM